MQTKASKLFISRLNAIVVGTLFCVIAVLLNLVAANLYARLDLTQDRVYTLSEVSRKTMAELEDVLQVRYYISRRALPPAPAFERLEQEISDMLAEYAAFSGGKLRFEVVDPLEGRTEIPPEVQDRLEAEGVLASSDVVLKNDAPFPIEFFSSVKLNYVDKTEVINDIRAPDNFEFEFTRAVRRMTAPKMPVIGFYFSEKDTDLSADSGFGTIATLLRKDYLVRPVSLGKDDPVPADIDVLFVVARDVVPDRHKYEIDQFIMRGGKTVFLLDIFNPQKFQRTQWGQPPIFLKADSNLGDMLESYGVKPISSMVFDIDQCGIGRRPKIVPTRFGVVEKMEIVRFPPIIKTRKHNYEKGFGFINQLDNIAVRFASCLEPSSRATAERGVSFIPLVKTSQSSWKVPFDFVFTQQQIEETIDNPEALVAKHNPKGEQYTLFALLEGRFESFYADKPVPDPVVDPEDEAEATKPKEEEPPKPKPETIKETAQPNRIVVIADSDCMTDEFLSWEPNAQFFANFVEWLAAGEDLARIRAKAGRSRPLRVSESARVWYQVLMIGLMPLLVVITGVGRYILRRSRGD